ncbi:hypothetical protein [Leptobacterium sp. I13]|uniref:hypothetical protein n=1 Tax=Leptobacterium meishanense TaxID=3128904 RepID=UPI0030EEEEEA
MRRKSQLIEKRNAFVKAYVAKHSDKQMKVIIAELKERLFISERTIFNILKDGD